MDILEVALNLLPAPPHIGPPLPLGLDIQWHKLAPWELPLPPRTYVTKVTEDKPRKRRKKT